MARTHATPRDPGLEEIDRWVAWFRAAHLDVIHSNPDMDDSERARAIVEAARLADALGEQLKYEYRVRTAPR